MTKTKEERGIIQTSYIVFKRNLQSKTASATQAIQNVNFSKWETVYAD